MVTAEGAGGSGIDAIADRGPSVSEQVERREVAEIVTHILLTVERRARSVWGWLEDRTPDEVVAALGISHRQYALASSCGASRPTPARGGARRRRRGGGYELPNLGAVDFLIRGLLGSGATSTVRLDAQAKALGEWLRSRSTAGPRSLVEA
jgi:hypothetical protein